MEFLNKVIKLCILITPISITFASLIFYFLGNHGWGFWSDLKKLLCVYIEWLIISYILIFAICVTVEIGQMFF